MSLARLRWAHPISRLHGGEGPWSAHGWCARLLAGDADDVVTGCVRTAFGAMFRGPPSVCCGGPCAGSKWLALHHDPPEASHSVRVLGR
jgi:hypothetical protein